LDLIQRVYRRLLSHVSPVKTCETVFGARMHCHSGHFDGNTVRMMVFASDMSTRLTPRMQTSVSNANHSRRGKIS